MANLNSIDMTDVAELSEGTFRIIPPGEYQVLMESSDFKKTKNGDGEYLECVLIVCDGAEYDGAKVFVRLNLINKSDVAVRIAKEQLRALCEAIYGQPSVNDSSMLHSRPFFAYIDNVPMNKDDPNSKRSNEVVFRKGTIRSLKDVPPPTKATKPVVAAQAAPVQATSAVTPGAGLPPWKKK